MITRKKILILFVENYSAGGSDKVASLLYKNLPFDKTYLFINKSNNLSILLPENNESNVSPIFYKLVTIAELGNYANSKKSNFVIYFLLKVMNLLIRYPLLLISVFYFYFKFKDLDADVFIANNGGYPGGEYCRMATIAAYLAKIKNFHIVHSIPTSIFFKPFTFIENCIDKQIEKISTIICVSEDIKRKLKLVRNIKENVKIIHNGIQSQNQKKYIKSDTLKLLNVASLYSLKNQIFLIEGIRKLVDLGYDNIELHLVGKEEELGYLNKMQKLCVKYKLENKIIFHGFCDPHKYYMECDVFVLSSKIEGFPMVILEAMSIGLPIISTNVGGTKEQIIDGYNGFLIENGNTNDFVKRIKFFLEDRNKIREFGNNGYVLFNENFTIGKMIKDYNKIFSDI